jgi:hypothetical protein
MIEINRRPYEQSVVPGAYRNKDIKELASN